MFDESYEMREDGEWTRVGEEQEVSLCAEASVRADAYASFRVSGHHNNGGDSSRQAGVRNDKKNPGLTLWLQL